MTNPLKVLLVNDYGRATGGAELQMLAIRDGLRRRGHQVRLFSSDAALTGGFPLLADRSCRGRTDIGQALTQTINLDALAQFRQELREFAPQVVHIRMFLWQISPLILPLLKRTPTFFQPAVYKAICPNGLKLLPNGDICTVRPGRVCVSSGCVAPKTWASAMVQRAMVRWWRSSFDKVATLSSRMAGLFAEDGWENVAVLGNGVDDRPMRPALQSPPTIAYAGRLSREKGIGVLMEALKIAAKKNPDLLLLIAGTGPEHEALSQGMGELHAKVRFLGHLSRPQMESEFDRAWVQVVPSLWHEPFGNVTTEAMMRGTAVIASDVGGQSDLVRHGETGFLVQPSDPIELAAKLELLTSDRNVAERMGMEGRRVAIEQYSREATLTRLEAMYADTITAFETKMAR